MTRTLSARALNRAVLARQLLLERASSPVPRVLERMAGLQAQYAPAMYLGLWSRVAGLERDTVTRLLEARTIVQGTLLRSTIHLVTRGDYWPFALGIRAARREWFLRVRKGQVTAAELERAAQRLRAALAHGPINRAALNAVVEPAAREGVGLWLDLIRVPPSGTWERRRADLFEAADTWLGAPAAVEPEAGVQLLVRRYLGGFGPASRSDIATWAGLPVATIAGALDRLTLRRFRAEDGTELVDLPRAPRPDPATPAPVRFLPTWDAALLVHARRALILPEAYRPRIFHTKAPQSFPTFLVDGAVAGTWRHAGGRIQLEEFHPLDAATRRELAAEGERLAAFHTQAASIELFEQTCRRSDGRHYDTCLLGVCFRTRAFPRLTET